MGQKQTSARWRRDVSFGSEAMFPVDEGLSNAHAKGPKGEDGAS